MTHPLDLVPFLAHREAVACGVAAATAVVLAVLLVPMVRRLAWRLGAVDVPRGRHQHAEPTARLGGLALCAAILLALAAGLAVLDEVPAELRRQGMAIAGTAVAVCLLGARDDLRPLSPSAKLLGLGAAAAALVACGVHIRYVQLPWLGHLELGPFAGLVTIAWVLAVTNSVNLIDGVDGLGAGLGMVAAAVLALVAFGMGDTLSAVLLCATAGACTGFLKYNRQPARIFLGDSGSLLLGYLLAAVSVAGCTKRATALFLFAAMCALVVPLVDSTDAFVRRFRKALTQPGRQRVLRALRATMVGDRGHLHHRLLSAGFSHRQVARAVALTSLLCGLSALLLLPTGRVDAITACGAFVAGAWVVWQLAKRPGRARTAAPPAPTEPEVVLPAGRPQSPAKAKGRTARRQQSGPTPTRPRAGV